MVEEVNHPTVTPFPISTPASDTPLTSQKGQPGFFPTSTASNSRPILTETSYAPSSSVVTPVPVINPISETTPSELGSPPTYEETPAPGTSFPRPSRVHQFATAHPNWISSTLESKLERAGYNPALDPDLITPDVWLERYGVGDFELRSLREAYRE